MLRELGIQFAVVALILQAIAFSIHIGAFARISDKAAQFAADICGAGGDRDIDAPSGAAVFKVCPICQIAGASGHALTPECPAIVRGGGFATAFAAPAAVEAPDSGPLSPSARGPPLSPA